MFYTQLRYIDKKRGIGFQSIPEKKTAKCQREATKMTEYRGDGLRAQRIQDQRERELEDLEIRKKKLTDNLEMKDIANKFSATYDSVAGEISAATVSVNSLCILLKQEITSLVVILMPVFRRSGWSPSTR